jgi:hypothetical protein
MYKIPTKANKLIFYFLYSLFVVKLVVIAKKEMPEVGLLDDKSRTQLNDFLSSYPEDCTFQENSIYYDIRLVQKTILKPSSDLLNCLKLNRRNSLLVSRYVPPLFLAK